MVRLSAVATVLIAALSTVSHAACTEKDQEAKVNQLGGLLMPLMSKDPARAQKISEGMQNAMMQQGDAACTALDRLIADSK